MSRTSDAATTTAEVCPVCASLDVRVVESLWFALALERENLREADAAVEFTCRECAATWS